MLFSAYRLRCNRRVLFKIDRDKDKHELTERKYTVTVERTTRQETDRKTVPYFHQIPANSGVTPKSGTPPAPAPSYTPAINIKATISELNTKTTYHYGRWTCARLSHVRYPMEVGSILSARRARPGHCVHGSLHTDDPVRNQSQLAHPRAPRSSDSSLQCCCGVTKGG
ncbi:hypothetical protein EVAR_49672_1 [Eumeta japonica]|uniref:Uncharacterized protein n=1 Tax=Eumeta variegata TaxID=151549 RepID=A0A4C1WTQ0_EUMVA|nr:hypothetical protein EVAR_49672_1 [Eumeta japonica]